MFRNFIPSRYWAFHHCTFHLHTRDGPVLKFTRHWTVEGFLTRCLQRAPVTFHWRLEAALLCKPVPVETRYIGRSSLKRYCFIWLRQIAAGSRWVQAWCGLGESRLLIDHGIIGLCGASSVKWLIARYYPLDGLCLQVCKLRRRLHHLVYSFSTTGISTRPILKACHQW